MNNGALLCLAMGDCFSYRIAGVLRHCKSQIFTHLYKQLLCKQLRWIKDIILHSLSFLGMLLPMRFDCTNIWEQWKKSRHVKANWEHTLFWILSNCLLFWQRKRVGWMRILPKPHAEVNPKTEYIQGIFHSAALWWTSGRGTLPWQDRRQRRASCPRDRSCRLQGQKSAVTSAGPSDSSGLAFILDVASACQADSILHPDTLQMNMPWHPPALRLPLEMDNFLGGSLSGGSRGTWQWIAKRCVLICAAVLVCGWAPGVGKTWSQTHSAPGQGWDVFSPNLSQGNGWLEVLFASSSSCHLNIPFQLSCIFNNPSFNNSLFCYIILCVLKVILDAAPETLNFVDVKLQ